MYKLKIDLFLHEPIVLEFESKEDRDSARMQIYRELRDDRVFSLGPSCGYQGGITINPAYVRTLEVVEE